MADPILVDTIRAQWIWQGDSMLPEDRFINTWAAKTAGPSPTDVQLDAFDAALEVFYTGALPSVAYSLHSRMGHHVTASSTQCRMYRLGQEPPRDPTIYDHNLSATAAAGNNLPAEVAVCLSLRCGTGSGRTMGRVYLGPFTDAISEYHDHDLRPSDLFAGQVCGQVTALQAELEGEGLALAVVSGTQSESFAVVGGYVDNAFDTQRRRGLDPTDRQVWTVA